MLLKPSRAWLACVLVLAVWLWAGQAWAAVAFVQSASSSDDFPGSTTATVTFATNTTAGNAVVCWLYWGSQTIALSSVGNGTNTATLSGNPTTVSTSGRAAWAVIENGAASANTITATFDASLSFSVAVNFYCHEVSGVATSSAVDVHAMNVQASPGTTTDAVTSGAVTTTANGDYIFGASKDYGVTGSVVNAGTGYTSRTTGSNGAISESLVQGSAGSIAATFTTDLSFSSHVSGILALKAAAAGGGTSGCLLLQDGTSKIVLQDGSGGHLLQGGGSCGIGGGGGPSVVPANMLLGVGL